MSQSWSSTLQVLTVESELRKSTKTGNEYPHWVARCIVLDDDGAVITVGSLPGRRVRDEGLRAKFKTGTFRVTFGLQVPDFGDDKGEIVAMVTDVQPVQLRAPGAAPAAPAKVAA